jgi:hypothetical protein
LSGFILKFTLKSTLSQDYRNRRSNATKKSTKREHKSLNEEFKDFQAEAFVDNKISRGKIK